MTRAVKCSAAVMAAVCAAVFGVCAKLGRLLPDEITAYSDEPVFFNNFSTISFNNQSKNAKACADERYFGRIELFDVIPVKNVTVRQTEKKYVVPCGTLFGIKFYAKGAAVIECCDIAVADTTVNPGRECGLQPGDAIISIDGCEINNCGDVERLTMQSSGESLQLCCRRGGCDFMTDIKPVKTDGGYRLGLWIKDSAAGLGTMTFYDIDSGCFASLGHGICDDETGGLLELKSAEITAVEVASITKGCDGSPGIINGYFSGDPIGSAFANSECGLFGTLDSPADCFAPVEVANIQDVSKGHAQILCTLDGSVPQLYDIEITRVDYDEKNKTKNLQIAATDSRLIEKTGGIIQGMSGSPILQNGKLVGAVTHVLVTNSVKGYGIFAQNMYEELEKTRI